MASVSSLGRATAVKRLRKEFEKMRKAPAPGISARPRYNSARDEVDWFTWDCAMVGPVDSPYEDGLFRALIQVPSQYPMMPVSGDIPREYKQAYPDVLPIACNSVLARLRPDLLPISQPKMSFVTPITHPNVYSREQEGAMPGERHTRGEVCISILKPPGRDLFGEAPEDTRWRASLSIEAVLLSVQSLLIDPNPDSPANTDAATLWRNNRAGFMERARRNVANSLGLHGAPPRAFAEEVATLSEQEYKALIDCEPGSPRNAASGAASAASGGGGGGGERGAGGTGRSTGAAAAAAIAGVRRRDGVPHG